VEWSTWSTSAASLYFHLIFCLCGWFRCSLFSEFLPGREGVKDQAPCLIGTGMTNLLSQFVKLLAFPLGSHVAYLSLVNWIRCVHNWFESELWKPVTTALLHFASIAPAILVELL
jgi:hypothetical protein